MKIGVVGFSSPQFDQERAKVILKTKLKELVSSTNNENIELVSGYTNSGIPKIAYEIADSMGLKTIGFSAKKALSSSYGLYPVDKKIIFGKNFGDESQAFIDYIDVLLRVGGGKQSRAEVELFKKKNEGVNLTELLFEEEVEWHGK